ncbi:Vesicle-mediated ER to Golgi transport protein [Rhodotorula kratochvilovae]
MFSTIARGYGALQASAQPQSATTTIDRLCDRILQGDSREDRRAALLGLKGLSRDWKTEVGSRALPILLGVLEEDAAEDTEMAKAVVETLSLLCEVEEHDGRPVRDDSGLRNTDVFLATPTALHTLLTLLTPSHFYLRFFSLQLLGILLANRPQQVQQYVLTAAGGIGRLVETLDDSREIIRNESLLLLIALTTQNADIQKLLAFEGAFDKLFAIVRSEGGIGSGGIVVQDCLAAIGGLLRWNVSNQNYFRETSCIPILAPLLLFPRPNALSAQSLATFAFQSWSEQKVINAGLVISLVRMLVGGAGGSGRSQNQDALLRTGLTRCLIELALASNAPAVLKSQSLNALADIMRASPDNQSLLTSLIVTPLIPPQTPSSPETYAGEDGSSADHPRSSLDHAQDDHPHSHAPTPVALKWRRGTPVPAVVAVTALAVNGDGTPGREGLRVRAAAANLFTSYVAGSNDTQLGILSTMSAPQPFDGAGADGGQQTSSAGSIILHALRVFPAPVARGEQLDSYVPFFAALLFAHLVCHSEVCKEAARRIYFQGDDTEPGGAGDPDDRQSLVSILVGNLMMAQREQAQSANAGLGQERGLEWSRVMVGYLTALSVWLWESPVTVKEFLSEGSNLQVLIQPITQSSGVDSLIQGLCTFLLGICYEFNREPGPITRETLHPILQSRVGPDQFVSRILRLREDPRFRNVGPAALELIDDGDEASADDLGEEDGLWFDFAFVEFLKTNYVSVQRAILVDPHASSASTRSLDGVSPEVLLALRSSLAAQTREIDELREQVRMLEAQREDERAAIEGEFASLSDSIVSLRTQLAALQAEKDDADREQEDLLVLLEELSEKRRRDKRRMRRAGLDVSEDEEGAEEEDDSEEEEQAREEAPAPAPASALFAAEPERANEHEAPAPAPAPASPPAPAQEAAQPIADEPEYLPHISPPLAAAPEFAAALAAEPSAALEAALAPAPAEEAPAAFGAQPPIEEVEAVEEVEEVDLAAAPVAPEPAPQPPVEPTVETTPEPAPVPASEPAAVLPPPPASAAAAPPPPRASHFPSSSSSSSASRAHGLPPAEAIEPVIEVDERNPGPRAGIPPPPRATGARGLVSLRAGGGGPGSPRRPGTPQRARVEPIANPFGLAPASSQQEEQKEQKGEGEVEAEEELVTLAPPPPPAAPVEPEAVPAEEEKMVETAPPPAVEPEPVEPEPKHEETPSAPATAPAPEHDRRTSVDDRLAAAFGGSGAAFSYSPPAPAAPPSPATAAKDTSSLFGGSSNGAHDTASLFGGAPSAGAAASSIASIFGAGAGAASSNFASFFGGGQKQHQQPASPPQPKREEVPSPFAPKREDAASPFAPKREDAASPFAPKREQAASPFAPPPPRSAPSPFAPPPRKDAASPYAPPPRQDAPSPYAPPAQPQQQQQPSPFAPAPAQDASSLFGGPPVAKQDAAAFFAAPQQHQQQAGTFPFGMRQAASPFGGSAGSREDSASPFGAPARQQQQQRREDPPAVAARDVSSLFG